MHAIAIGKVAKAYRVIAHDRPEPVADVPERSLIGGNEPGQPLPPWPSPARRDHGPPGHLRRRSAELSEQARSGRRPG
ncbi:hypothetical protein [Amycolatopsis sp. cmx-4-68]|uniref:hypothetical protein n=1 Tax=Amycolatopsis sp. cmx-4-68 TaxID=2790938 RepID=UPI0039789DA8